MTVVKESIQEKFEGYDKLDTELTLTKLNNVGEFMQGIYEGIEEIKTPDGLADYLTIKTEGIGVVALPVNPSLRRALKQIKEGQHIIVELSETVPSKGGKQDFKRYSVYRKKQALSQPNNDIPF